MSSCHSKIKFVKLAILFYIVRPYVYIKKSYANEKDLERAKNLLKKIENEVSNFEKSNNIKWKMNFWESRGKKFERNPYFWRVFGEDRGFDTAGESSGSFKMGDG